MTHGMSRIHISEKYLNKISREQPLKLRRRTSKDLYLPHQYLRLVLNMIKEFAVVTEDEELEEIRFLPHLDASCSMENLNSEHETI